MALPGFAFRDNVDNTPAHHQNGSLGFLNAFDANSRNSPVKKTLVKDPVLCVVNNGSNHNDEISNQRTKEEEEGDEKKSTFVNPFLPSPASNKAHHASPGLSQINLPFGGFPGGKQYKRDRAPSKEENEAAEAKDTPATIVSLSVEKSAEGASETVSEEREEYTGRGEAVMEEVLTEAIEDEAQEEMRGGVKQETQTPTEVVKQDDANGPVKELSHVSPGSDPLSEMVDDDDEEDYYLVEEEEEETTEETTSPPFTKTPLKASPTVKLTWFVNENISPERTVFRCPPPNQDMPQSSEAQSSEAQSPHLRRDAPNAASIPLKDGIDCLPIRVIKAKLDECGIPYLDLPPEKSHFVARLRGYLVATGELDASTQEPMNQPEPAWGVRSSPTVQREAVPSTPENNETMKNLFETSDNVEGAGTRAAAARLNTREAMSLFEDSPPASSKRTNSKCMSKASSKSTLPKERQLPVEPPVQPQKTPESCQAVIGLGPAPKSIFDDVSDSGDGDFEALFTGVRPGKTNAQAKSGSLFDDHFDDVFQTCGSAAASMRASPSRSPAFTTPVGLFD